MSVVNVVFIKGGRTKSFYLFNDLVVNTGVFVVKGSVVLCDVYFSMFYCLFHYLVPCLRRLKDRN